MESTDSRFRDVTIAETLLSAVQSRLAAVAAQVEPPRDTPALVPPRGEGAGEGKPARPYTVLDTIDLSARLEKPSYEAKLEKAQAKLHWLAREAHQRGKPAILVFEGWDASGKGSSIRRLARAQPAHVPHRLDRGTQ